jgi:hypothetical protein
MRLLFNRAAQSPSKSKGPYFWAVFRHLLPLSDLLPFMRCGFSMTEFVVDEKSPLHSLSVGSVFYTCFHG